MIVVLGTVLAAVAAGSVAVPEPSAAWNATQALVGLLYLVIGAVAWSRRPGNRMGVLICVTGVLFLLATLTDSALPVPVFLGVFGAQTVLAAILHLLLAFPSGRLGGTGDRVLVGLGYLSTLVPFFLQYAFSGQPFVLPFVDGGARPEVVALAGHAHSVVASLVLLSAAVVLVRRWRAARTGAEKRSRALVSVWGIAVLVSIPFTFHVVAPVLGLSGQQRFLLQLACVSAVPVVIAVAILRGGFARTARIEDLGHWLGDPHGPSVRVALAEALGDPSLQLRYPAPGGELVDAAGREADLPAGARVRVGSAVIAYDAALNADPAVVEQAGRVVALALERERLTAELLARSRELRASRARLVEVADTERRRIAQDLHDTLQGRLVLATLRAGALAERPGVDERSRADAAALRTELTDGIAEVRRLVHGLMPALLIERGLHAAAEDLLDRSPIPVEAHWEGRLAELPSTVACGAYFILAEALANAIKHSGAARIRVRVARSPRGLELDFADDGIGGASPTGAGLRGVRDRVDVLGGEFALASPPGAGTRVEVRVPCGS